MSNSGNGFCEACVNEGKDEPGPRRYHAKAIVEKPLGTGTVEFESEVCEHHLIEEIEKAGQSFGRRVEYYELERDYE